MINDLKTYFKIEDDTFLVLWLFSYILKFKIILLFSKTFLLHRNNFYGDLIWQKNKIVICMQTTFLLFFKGQCDNNQPQNVISKHLRLPNYSLCNTLNLCNQIFWI